MTGEIDASQFPEPMAQLVREHRTIETVVSEAREAASAAAGHPPEDDRFVFAIERLRDLEAFMQVDLMLHIAKEEEVLFPALRSLGAEAELVIEDMLAQHDSVRERHDALQRALQQLDHDHEDVRNARTALSQELANGATTETMPRLREIVRGLDSILQGHFFDEEDGLFEPATQAVPPARLAELTAAMADLDAAMR